MRAKKLWYGSFDTGPSHVNSEGTNTQPQKIATLIISHYSYFKAPIPTIANAIEPIATIPSADELKGTHKNFATNARVLSPQTKLGSTRARMFAFRDGSRGETLLYAAILPEKHTDLVAPPPLLFPRLIWGCRHFLALPCRTDFFKMYKNWAVDSGQLVISHLVSHMHFRLHPNVWAQLGRDYISCL